MKNTQNQKISQIKNETLVVGIDVAKETHYARAFDYRHKNPKECSSYEYKRFPPPPFTKSCKSLS
jgi:transposase